LREEFRLFKILPVGKLSHNFFYLIRVDDAIISNVTATNF